jgi:hypothetical protein
MHNSIFSSVLETLQEHISLTQNCVAARHSRELLFDPSSHYSSIPPNLPDVTSRFSPLGLPPALSYELNSLLVRDLNEDKASIETARQRLLQQLSTASTSPDPSVIPSLVQAAFDAFYNRSINSRMDALQQELSHFSLQDGSASESGDSSDSDQGVYNAPSDHRLHYFTNISLREESASLDDDDEGEEAEEAVDEDDNAPVRPGEDIPPLDTVCECGFELRVPHTNKYFNRGTCLSSKLCMNAAKF